MDQISGLIVGSSLMAVINKPGAFVIGIAMLAAGIWLLVSSEQSFRPDASVQTLERGRAGVGFGGGLFMLSVFFLAYATFLGDAQQLFTRLGFGNLFAG